MRDLIKEKSKKSLTEYQLLNAEHFCSGSGSEVGGNLNEKSEKELIGKTK